jgi:general stress protein 26
MNPKRKLLDLIGDFDSAMLITHTQGNVSARPMEIARLDESGEMWFAADRRSGKIAEIDKEPSVGVTFQKAGKFAYLSGQARLNDDRSLITNLWRDDWKAWFPGGKDDPNLILIHVIPDEGEYWDNSLLSGLKYAVESGLAYWQGEQTRLDVNANAVVQMD